MNPKSEIPNPKFIVFEGGEGSGKSTASAAIAERLRAAGVDVAHTREPGGTRVGELVRGLLHEPLTPLAELFAFLVARAQIVEEVIRPALEQGATVICDRFSPSTFAYQVYARGLDEAAVRQANTAATSGLEPDLVVYLDIDPEVGLRRKHGETEAIRTGLEGLAFHRKVRDGYLAQAATDPERWLVVDGGISREEVVEAVWAGLNR